MVRFSLAKVPLSLSLGRCSFRKRIWGVALMSEAFSKPTPAPGEFFKLRPDARRRGPGHGVFFENEEELVSPPRLSLRPKAVGFPRSGVHQDLSMFLETGRSRRIWKAASVGTGWCLNGSSV